MKMSFTDFLFYRAAPQIKSRPSEPLIFQQTKKERGELDICNNGRYRNRTLVAWAAARSYSEPVYRHDAMHALIFPPEGHASIAGLIPEASGVEVHARTCTFLVQRGAQPPITEWPSRAWTPYSTLDGKGLLSEVFIYNKTASGEKWVLSTAYVPIR